MKPHNMGWGSAAASDTGDMSALSEPLSCFLYQSTPLLATLSILHVPILKFWKSPESASSATPFSHAKALGSSTASSQEPGITLWQYGDTSRVAKIFLLKYQAVERAFEVS
jgi:hypothetical protein